MTRALDRLRAAWPAAVILGALATFFFPALAPEQQFYARDILRMHVPMRQFASDRLLRGELPLWWPYEGLGAPFAAQGLTAVFHPVAVALAFVPAPQAMKALMLLSYAAAALGTFALARRLGLSRLPAVAAGLAYALSGYLVSVSGNWQYLAGACLLPWTLWATDRMVRDSRRYVLAQAIALALIVLAGDYQGAYTAALADLGWATWRAGPAVGRVRGALLAVTSAAAALALCGVQIAASAELFGESVRRGGLEPSHATAWSLHPLRLIELVAGSVPSASSQGIPSFLLQAPLRGVWADAVYAGAPVVALAIGATTRHAERHPCAPGLAIAGVVGLLLAMGSYGGLFVVAREVLPFWSAFRYPEKLLPFATLSVALLLGLGLDEVARGRNRVALPLAAVAAFALSFGLTLAATVSRPLAERSFINGLSAAAALSCAACVLASAAAHLAGRARGDLAAAVLAIVCVGDLAWRNRHFYDVAPSSALDDVPPFAAALGGAAHGGKYRLMSAAGRSPVPVAPTGLSNRAATAVWAKNALAPLHNARYGIEAVATYLPGVLDRVDRVQRRLGSWHRWAPFFGVRFAVFRRSTLALAHGSPVRLIAERGDLDLALVELGPAAPRAYVACPEPASSLDDALDRIGDPSFGWGRVAVVERPNAGPDEPALACASDHDRLPGRATVEVYEPERVAVRVDAARPAVLVLNDAYYPGWRAELDGRTVPVLPANVAVRGVEVPAGSHQVVFEYHPAWLAPGAAVSSGSVIVMIGAAAVGSLRARRARAAGRGGEASPSSRPRPR